MPPGLLHMLLHVHRIKVPAVRKKPEQGWSSPVFFLGSSLCVDNGDAPSGLRIDVEIIGQPIRAGPTAVSGGVECPAPRTDRHVVATGLGAARDLDNGCSHNRVVPWSGMPMVVGVSR